MVTKAENAELTAKVEQKTGTKYCSSCNKHKPADTFKVVKGRAKCKWCRERMRASIKKSGSGGR